MRDMLLAKHKKRFLHRIVTSDEKWIYHDNPKIKKIMGTSCPRVTSTAKPNIMEKTHAVYLVGPAGCSVLRVAKSKRNNHWNSIPNTTDEIEPSSEGKTLSIILQIRQNYSST
ncbi:Mariner Mos1 transposase [Eumeta japonica]|uniref:Mariner Mos1 transposase n=1 Tax=Eumeta variegata TaxID=151549 RepID=A0A4C1STD9_EUMVA|nr:Mariner Mos1 transposase [Eumeta japonica]